MLKGNLLISLCELTDELKMLRIQVTRKARFKSALAMVGMTQAEWAKQNEITADHLSMVISETYDRESKVLEDKIDAFTAEVAAKVLAA